MFARKDWAKGHCIEHSAKLPPQIIVLKLLHQIWDLQSTSPQEPTKGYAAFFLLAWQGRKVFLSFEGLENLWYGISSSSYPLSWLPKPIYLNMTKRYGGCWTHLVCRQTQLCDIITTVRT